MKKWAARCVTAGTSKRFPPLSRSHCHWAVSPCAAVLAIAAATAVVAAGLSCHSDGTDAAARRALGQSSPTDHAAAKPLPRLPSPSCRRHRRHLHRHRGVRRAHRAIRPSARRCRPRAPGRGHQCRRREGRQRLSIAPACSCTARPSPSTPCWSAPARGPRCSSPRAFATSTRSAASTGPTPTTCSSASTSRWSSARCASRSRSACSPTARSTRRSTRRRSPRSAAGWKGSASRPTAILFLNCYARHEHEARAKAILERNHPGHVRLGLARAVAGIPRVRALLDGGRQRLYRPDGAPLYRRDRGPHPRRRLSRLVPDRAVDRRAVRGRAGPGPVRAHAGIGAGRRRDRHAGAVPHARHRQRHRLRHGRHHRQGRRDLPGRGAHHRRGADRRLRPGAAGADRHDGHFRGRHRRRLDRAGRGRRAAGRPAERRRRARARPATGSAAPSRRSPTPIWCSAGSAPTASSAARCSSTSRPPSARWTSAWRSRSGWTRSRRPTASCASPPPPCPTRSRA